MYISFSRVNEGFDPDKIRRLVIITFLDMSRCQCPPKKSPKEYVNILCLFGVYFQYGRQKQYFLGNLALDHKFEIFLHYTKKLKKTMNDHHTKYYEILMNLTRVMVIFSSLKL